MVTLGIDPGTAKVGYGVICEDDQKITLVDYGCITTSKDSNKEERLKKIHSQLTKLIEKFNPRSIAVEQLFFCSNAKTALSVGEARGVVLLACAQAGIPLSEYTPLQVKQALTGYGRAEKSQIQHMVKNLLKLKDIPKPDDAADALAIAICHVHSQKFNRLTERKNK